MQRVIIFDSPDGTGKTNIAKSLSGVLGIPYFKMNTEHDNWRAGRFKDALEFDQPYLLQFLKQTGHSAIIDRAYPAEWVYSRIYRRETNDELLRELDYGFSRLGTNIVIPLRNSYAGSRKDELVRGEVLPLLHEGYINFSAWTVCHAIPIYVDELGNDLLGELREIIPRLEFL